MHVRSTVQVAVLSASTWLAGKPVQMSKLGVSFPFLNFGRTGTEGHGYRSISYMTVLIVLTAFIEYNV